MNKTLFLSTFLSFIFLIFQADLNGQTKMKENQSKGLILVKGKKTDDGIIELASLSNPWENQRKVKYIKEKTFNKGKVKKKDWEKYKPKDIDGYQFGDRVFVVEKYTPVGTALQSTNVNKLTTATALAGSLSKNKHFMELVLDGEIKVYRFYNYPPEASAQVGNDQIGAYAEMVENIRTYYEVLIKVGKKGKVQNFKKVKIEELLAGCEEVKTKYLNGEYALKKNAMNQLLKVGGGGYELEKSVVEMIRDYNNCKK
ncbi:MAG TPA: hypothetical protein ENJ95_15555 [Bacteroidetes bacterium]|nr:hypothetical protein [Bacteroidota bacterium]